RRRFGQNPDPAKWIFAIIGRERSGRNARPANTVKAVAPADKVAGQLSVLAVVAEANFRRAAAKIVHAYVARLEQNLPAVGKPPLDQVLHHLLLAVDGPALAGELAEIDVVQGAAERKIDAVVEHALALHARADAGLDQEIARPLLDQAGADAALDIVAAAVFQDDALHAIEVEEMRQHQPGGPRADDTDLRAHLALPAVRPSAVTLIGIAGSRARRDSLGIALPISAVLTQRRREVGDEIVGVLDADREPHQGIADAQTRTHLRRHRAVGHQRGVLDQALDAADAFRPCGQPAAFHEAAVGCAAG